MGVVITLSLSIPQPFWLKLMLVFSGGSTRAILLGLGALRTHATIVPFGRK